MQTCGATRDRVNDPYWECDGTNLVVVIPASASLPPVVVRRDLIVLLGNPERSFMHRDGGQDFAGGDHVHLQLRPPGERAEQMAGLLRQAGWTVTPPPADAEARP